MKNKQFIKNLNQIIQIFRLSYLNKSSKIFLEYIE